MAVRYANSEVKKARIIAGLSQEKMSDGICTAKSLSRIEQGKAGICPSTFKLLMERANANYECAPIFANKTDYECYCMLHRVSFYLDSWKLSLAYDELTNIANLMWANNRIYYQEWLMYHCRLQYLSFCADHNIIYNNLLEALHITKKSLAIDNWDNQYLTNTEIILLIYLAQETLYCGQNADIPGFYTNMTEYLSSRNLSNLEKQQLQSLCDIVYGKYLLSVGDYSTAYHILDNSRNTILLNNISNCLYEITFLLGLAAYHTKNYSIANKMIESVFFATHAVSCCYSTVCKQYLSTNTEFSIPEYWMNFDIIPLIHYDYPNTIDWHTLSDGSYKLSSPEIYTIGTIIKNTRKKLHISQVCLCNGLCSKSMLSKIENNYIQPELALTEVLLQRLGISERIFNFWSDEEDSNFNFYKFFCMYRQHIIPQSEYYNAMMEFKSHISDSDVLYKQQYLSMTADTADKLLHALSLTLPEFDISQITNYRLSWEELSELNMLGELFRKDSSFNQSITCFENIIKYDSQANNDILLRHNYFSLTLSKYCHALYSAKQFSEILKLGMYCTDILFHCNPRSFSFFLFFYSQALGECGQKRDAYKYGMYTYHLQTLFGLDSNASRIEQFLREDFDIKLNN